MCTPDVVEQWQFLYASCDIVEFYHSLQNLWFREWNDVAHLKERAQYLALVLM